MLADVNDRLSLAEGHAIGGGRGLSKLLIEIEALLQHCSDAAIAKDS